MPPRIPQLPRRSAAIHVPPIEPKTPPQLIRRRRRLASTIDPTIVSKHAPPSASSNPSSSPRRRASAIDPAIASKHAPPSASSNPSSSPLGWPLAQAEGSDGDTGGRRLLDWALSPAQDGPCGPGPPSSSPRAPAAGAGGSGGLSGGAPIFNQPSIAVRFSHCSDEFSCYSGSSSSSSYSGASARSCVSDSAQRGRPVDPLRVLSVVASLRRINPKMFAEATGELFHSGAEKKQKGVWIEVDNYEDQSKRSSVVASEGSTVTAAASASSTATSGRCRRPPRASGGGGRGGEKAPRRAEAIMQWFSRSQAGPATENDICVVVGDNSGMSKTIRWLLKQEGGLRRAGTGGLLDPYVYMKWVKWYVDVVVSFLHIPGVLFMFSVLVVGQ